LLDRYNQIKLDINPIKTKINQPVTLQKSISKKKFMLIFSKIKNFTCYLK